MGGDGLNNAQVRGDFNYVVALPTGCIDSCCLMGRWQVISWLLSEISRPTSSYEPSWKLLHKMYLITGLGAK